jgi:hypothetical protein
MRGKIRASNTVRCHEFALPPLLAPTSVTICAYVQAVRIESTQFWCLDTALY